MARPPVNGVVDLLGYVGGGLLLGGTTLLVGTSWEELPRTGVWRCSGP